MRARGMAALLLTLALAAAPQAIRAADEAVCAVRYVSSEHVYLDAGRLAGLDVGTSVLVLRDGVQIGELLVVHAADHSASCRIVNSTVTVVPGDRARFVPTQLPAGALPDTVAVAVRTRELRPAAVRRERARAPGPRLTGSMALRLEHATETGNVGLSTSTWTLPFRLRVRDLGRGWELRARGSLRRILRDGFGTSSPTDEWRNRIHEIALVRDGRREDWHLAAGRITNRAAAAAGPFDGLAVNRRVGGVMRLGLFGGFAPAWRDLGFSTADQVAGVTFQYDTAGAPGRGLHLLLAGMGRYHEGEISRENLAMTTTWAGAGGLSLIQSAEIDLNRGWRRDAGESSLDLSSFALGGRWRVDRRIAVRAGWDDRQPVRTWETRDRPDSLFQDAGRRGLNAGVELRDGAGRRLWLNGSLRSPRAGGPDSRSWSVRGRLPQWPWRELDLDASLRGFDGPYLAGLAPSLAVAWRGDGRWYGRAGGGVYMYRDQTGDDDRNSTWLSASLERTFARRWSALAELRVDGGDATHGRSILLELRRRF